LESLALAHWLTLSLAANLTFQTMTMTITFLTIFFHPCFFCSLASITTFCAGVMIQLFVPEVDKVINVKEENSPVKFPMYCTQLSHFLFIPEAMLMIFFSFCGYVHTICKMTII